MTLTDQTTFFLAFGLLFALLGLYLWRLESRARTLEARIHTLEAATKKGKNPETEPARKP
jgi:hypothetical protein